MEMAEIQTSLQSPFFPRLIEDGDRRCDFAVFPRPPPPSPYFEPKPNLSKTFKGLLMGLVIFENTIFQLNSLNITVSVCYVSGSKVNRKERSRPSLIVFFLFHLNISSRI